MSLRIPLILSILLYFICIVPSYAQVAQRLDITVKEIKGDVEIMPPDTAQWLVPEVGSSFSEGTQIRTGLFSSVFLFFADSSIVQVDSLSCMTVEKFFKSGNVVTTRINLMVGSTKNRLNEVTSFENDFKITTPSRTIPLNSRNEIKEVVAGAMYSDTVRAERRHGGNTDNNRNRSGGASQKEESAGQIAQETGVKRESSMAPTK